VHDCCHGTPLPAAPRYDALDVSHLDGIETTPVALDDTSALAGTYRTGTEEGVFLWDGSMQRFPIPSGRAARVAATAGARVVGSWSTGSGHSHAFVATRGSLIDLGTLGGDYSEAHAASASGTVVGASTTATGEVHAFSWEDGVMSDLGNLPGKRLSLAQAIDDAGNIFGLSCDATPQEFFRGGDWSSGCKAARFGHGAASDLGSIPDLSDPFAMAPNGDVLVGDFLWRAGAIEVDTPVLAATGSWRLSGVTLRQYSTRLSAENAAGDVVGSIWSPISEGEDAIAVLFHDGALFDLNDLVDLEGVLQDPARLSWTGAINGRGQVLASANRAGAYRMFLLTPK